MNGSIPKAEHILYSLNFRYVFASIQQNSTQRKKTFVIVSAAAEVLYSNHSKNLSKKNLRKKGEALVSRDYFVHNPCEEHIVQGTDNMCDCENLLWRKRIFSQYTYNHSPYYHDWSRQTGFWIQNITPLRQT